MELITKLTFCSVLSQQTAWESQVGSGSLPVRQVGAYCNDVPFLPSVNTAVCKQYDNKVYATQGEI